MYHPHERLVFQKREGNLAVEVWQDKDGHRRIDLLRQYEKDGEWRVTGCLGYANQRRGALLLQAAKKWINERDRAEGKMREAEQPKEPQYGAFLVGSPDACDLVVLHRTCSRPNFVLPLVTNTTP